MNDHTQLKTMINNIDSDVILSQQPENQMEAYLLAYRIQEGQKFFEYFNESGAKSPQTVVADYMRSIKAPAISTVSAINIKEVLFNDLHHNRHKTAILKGAAQAYFDLCLFLGLGAICTGQKQMNYAQAVESVNASLSALEKGYSKVCDSLSIMKWSGDLKDFQSVAEGTINFSQLKKSFEQSANIVFLYLSNKVKYTESYDCLVSSLSDQLARKEDDLFFSHVVTVLRNKDRFTDEQISHVNEVYTNRFTDEQKAAHKLNIPVETPSVSSTQAYFFKSKEQKNELADLV